MTNATNGTNGTENLVEPVVYVGPVINDLPEVVGTTGETEHSKETELALREGLASGDNATVSDVIAVNGVRFKTVEVSLDSIIVESNVRDEESLDIDDLVASFRMEGYDRTFPLMGHVRSDGSYGLIRGHRRFMSILHLRNNYPVEYDRHFGKNAKVPMLVPNGKIVLTPRQVAILKIDHSAKKRQKPLNSWEKFEAVRTLRRVGITTSAELSERLGMYAIDKKTGILTLQTSQTKKYLGWLHFNGSILREVRLFHLFGEGTLVNKTNGLRVCPEIPASLDGTDCHIETIVSKNGDVLVIRDDQGVAVSSSSRNVRKVARCTFANLDALGGVVRADGFGESCQTYTQCWNAMLDGYSPKFVKGTLTIPGKDKPESQVETDAPTATDVRIKDMMLNWGDNPIVRDALAVASGQKSQDALAETIASASQEVTLATVIRFLTDATDATVELVLTACQDRLTGPESQEDTESQDDAE